MDTSRPDHEPIDPAQPPPRVFAGRHAFSAAVIEALEGAADAGTDRLVLVDPDFSTWPLNDAAAVAALTRWARPSRRLTLVAHHYDEMPRRHPRFVAWRRTWSHVMHCRAAPELDASEIPTVLLAGEHKGLQLAERQHLRGRWLLDAASLRTCHEVVEAITQRTHESFPADTLGL